MKEVRKSHMATRNTDRNRQDRSAPMQIAAETERSPLRNRPANENDPGTAAMLAKLRRPPSYMVYVGAFALSIVWMFGWMLVNSNAIFFPPDNQAPSLPEAMRAVALLIVPIVIIWVLAYFLWRAQQLRQVSEVLMHSALRLVRPTDIASENLTSIAQAVRNEVDLLVGGVEHAYQRATALEEIVHKEMSAVERAFGSNEDRIRSLVSGLESQRVALQQTSQLVGGEAGPLLTRLESNTSNLNHVIDMALSTFDRLENGLKQSSDELARTIDDVSARAAIAGNEIGGHSQQFERISNSLMGDFHGFSAQLQDYVLALNGAASTLSVESSRFGGEVKGMESNLISLLRQSAEQLTSANHEVGTTIARLSTVSAADIRNAAGELSHTVSTVSDNISYHLKATTNEIAGLIEKSGVETAQRIEESRGVVTQGMQGMVGDFVGKVSQARADLTQYVDKAADQINVNFNAATTSLSQRIELAGTQMLTGLDQSGNQFFAQLNSSGADFAGRIEAASGALSDHLNQQVATVTNAMVVNTESYTQRIDESGHQILSGIERSSLNLLNGLNSSGGELTGRVEAAASSLLGGLNSTGGELASRFETSARNLLGGLDSTGSDILGRIDLSTNALLGGLSSTSTDIMTRIDQSSKTLLGGLNASGADVASRISNVSSGLLTGLSTQGADMVSRIEQATGSLLGNLDASSAGAVGRIEQASHTLTSQLGKHADLVASTVNATTADYTNKIEEQASQIMASFEITSKNMLLNLQTGGTEYTDRIAQAANSLSADLGQYSSAVSETIRNTSDAITATYDTAYNRAMEKLHLASTTLESAAEGVGQRVAESASLVVNQLQSSGSTVNDLLVSTSGTIAAHIKETSDIVTRQMQDSGIAVAQNIESSTGAVTERIISISGDFVDKLDSTRDDMLSVLQGTVGNVTSTLQGTSTQLFSRLEQTSTHIADQMESIAMRVNENIDLTAGSVTSRVVDVTEKLTRQLDVSSTTLGNLLDQTETRIGAQLDQATTELTGLFSGNTDRMTEQLSTTARDLGERLDIATSHLEQVTADVSGRLTSTSNLFVTALDGASGEIQSRLGTAQSTFESGIYRVQDAFAEGLGQTTMQITARFEQDTGLLVDRIDKANEEFADTATRASNSLLANVDKAVDEFAETAGRTANNLTVAQREFSTVVEGANTFFADQLVNATAASSKVVGDIQTRFAGSLAENQNRFASELDASQTRFSTTVSSVQLRVTDTLDGVQDRITEALTEAQDGFTSTLQSTTLAFASEVETATSKSSRTLDEVTQKFAGHIQTANTYFADQVATAASEMDEKLDSVSQNLTGKLEGTSTRLSERLEDVTTLVDRSVEKFNDEMERMLTSRRDALDTLVTDAARRATEVDSVMTSYMNLIEESLNAAENRARDISRIVADQTTQSMLRLEDELKKLEGSSAGQVNQAARVLREQHERALSSMNEMLSSTASDFQQTAQDMRITAQQVVKDIDAARGELKRAVIDLPEETRSNADAMRKVVADQIAALNALSEVVRRQSGTMDFSGPGYITPRGSTPGKSEGASFSAPAGTTSAPKTTSERSNGVEGTMAQIAASVKALSGSSAVKIAPRRREEPAETMPSNVAKDIAAYTTKLHAASREVVEAMDDGLPRDLEKRYVGGDKGVYTQRLNDSRSKRAIASLAARYRDERLLKSRVTAYIRLFEKLLDTLSDVPGGANTVDAVLASQSGEVYMMLAEAAGRLPEQ
jgi:hypothetical protein